LANPGALLQRRHHRGGHGARQPPSRQFAFAGATLLLDALGLPALFFFVAMDLSFSFLVSIVEALQQDGD